MEMLDANLVATPRGNPPNNFSQNAQDRTMCLRFTVTASLQLIIPGAMDFDPSTFPNPTLQTTVCVRALMQNRGLVQVITKHLLNNTPKLAPFFHQQAHAEFDVSIKHQSATVPDQEKHAKWPGQER
jgi:hypothetical protein